MKYYRVMQSELLWREIIAKAPEEWESRKIENVGIEAINEEEMFDSDGVNNSIEEIDEPDEDDVRVAIDLTTYDWEGGEE